LPAFGRYRIEKIDVLICQKHINEWHDKLKKYKIVYNYASKVFKYAITLRSIEENPMDFVIMPKLLDT